MNTESTKKRLAIAGCGKLGNILTDAWRSGLLPEYEIVGVLGRDRERAGSMASKAGCPAFETIEELLAFVRNEKGRPEAQAGAHDDCVMALAIAHYLRRSAPKPALWSCSIARGGW